MSASKDQLAELHELITKHFIDEIKNGEVAPSLVNAARQFLKDNGVDCSAEHNAPIRELKEILPFKRDPDLPKAIGED